MHDKEDLSKLIAEAEKSVLENKDNMEANFRGILLSDSRIKNDVTINSEKSGWSDWGEINKSMLDNGQGGKKSFDFITSPVFLMLILGFVLMFVFPMLMGNNLTRENRVKRQVVYNKNNAVDKAPTGSLPNSSIPRVNNSVSEKVNKSEIKTSQSSADSEEDIEKLNTYKMKQASKYAPMESEGDSENSDDAAKFDGNKENINPIM